MIKATIFMLSTLVIGSLIGQNANLATFDTLSHDLSIDIAQVKEIVQTSTLDSRLDQLVEQSIHANDRRFSQVG